MMRGQWIETVRHCWPESPETESRLSSAPSVRLPSSFSSLYCNRKQKGYFPESLKAQNQSKMETAGNGRWKPHFFKYILPPFQRLSIPIAFLKHLLDDTSEEGEGEATLRNHRCVWKSWPVKVKGFCFTDGWGDFVRDNHIRLGYFLVFRYEGAMVFDVIAFNHSCCEKDYSSHPPKPPEAIKKEAQEQENDDSQATDEEIKITPPSGRVMTRCNGTKATKPCTSFSESGRDSFKALTRLKHPVTIPKAFAESYGLTGKIFKVILRNEKGRTWLVKVNKYSDRLRMGAGWRAFASANHLKEGHSCLFKLNNSSRKTHKGGANAVVLDVSLSSERWAWVKNNGGPKMKPSLACNPIFVTVLKPFNFRESRLTVPVEFARSNGLTGKHCEMTLRDKKGRSWRGQLKHLKSNGTVSIYGNWVEISAANALRIGDTCLFELVRRKKMLAFRFF